jgi:hypothetical protein
VKKTTIWLCFLLIGACTHEKLPVVSGVDGHYTGVFTRNGISSMVELELKDGHFSGKSEGDKFPAICKGSYTYTLTTITFVDSCLWTTEFDWSLILNGEWHYTKACAKLNLSNSNGDQYVLVEQ